jgi:glycosyltransferase involved in cell wall biosynthesis
MTRNNRSILRNVAFLAVEPESGERGGAEAFHDGFCNALRDHGWNVDKIRVAIDESTFDGILAAYLRCYDLDVSQYDLVISSKAPSYAVRHPRHICYLLHTIRVFYDMFETEFASPTPQLLQQRALIQQLDTRLLAPTRVGGLFTIGDENLRRLRKYNALEAEVLYPGLPSDDFQCGKYGDYLFLPGRLHRWKRVGLLIEAMRYVRSDIQLRIAGTGEDYSQLVERAAGDRRIRFLGRITDAQCVELYANALAVPFVPVREDYGYVTLEAFRSGKSVITCTDSGTPADFVGRAEAGLVVEPTATPVAAAIDRLCADRNAASKMGERGRNSIMSITWANTASRIADYAYATLFGPERTPGPTRTRP